MFREITRFKQAISREECIEILKNEPRGVLSVLGDDGYPYGTPTNFWYCEDDGKLYFHGGRHGHRYEALQKNNKVSFCTYDKGFVKEGEWALNIKSVIVFGKIEFVEDRERAAEVCRQMSKKFTDDSEYIEDEIRRSGKVVLVYALTPEHMTGKLVNES